MRPHVLVTDPVAKDGLEFLELHADVAFKLHPSPQELLALIPTFEALIVRSETKVTKEVIEAGERLQVIARAGVGVDNIDVEAATSRGIVVVNAPTGNTVSAAEHTIALMMALARHIPQAHNSLKQGRWEREAFMGSEVRNKTLGIIGLGRVGGEVALRAKGLQMKVVAHDPYVSVEYAQSLGVQLAPLEELFKEADFISVHTPLTEATRGIIGDEEIARMKPGVYLLNVARGGVIEENALFKAVEAGRVAGAAVDVFSKEPPLNNPLLKSERIIVTPHLGASTAEAQSGVSRDVAEQVLAVLQGKPARYAVNTPWGPQEAFAAVAPFMPLASALGRLGVQLAEGQPGSLLIEYEGELSNENTTPLSAAALGGFLERVSEERVNLINARYLAQKRGIKVAEHKKAQAEVYPSLIALEVTTSKEKVKIAGTLLRGEPHIVRVNDYWVDLVPSGGYWLFSDHLDRPGLIGAVGNITGEANINISSMQVSRQRSRGPALMILGLDEPLDEAQQRKLLAIPDVYTAKVVRL